MEMDFCVVFCAIATYSLDCTEARVLGFSYDLRITVICHQNADAVVLASALMRGIHPPDNVQNADAVVLASALMRGIHPPDNVQNADAVVLASALMRGIHPPDNIQNGADAGS